MSNIKRVISVKLARKFGRGNKQNVPSIISENTKIKGNINSEGIIHIDGNIEGDIKCEELIIGVKGVVKGSITARNLHLYGALTGRAIVESLFVAKTAKLIGDATHTSIAIEPGAYIDGHCIRAAASAGTENRPDIFLIDSRKNRKVG